MKRPSFQFYPADWSANSNLRRCTHEEKGIWIDVMCLLHDQEEYGVARWALKEIAQAIGCSVAKLRGLVTKGVIKGCDANEISEPLVFVPRSGRKDGPPVTLIASQDGPIWFSSRMVIDEYKRVLRGESGATPKATPDHSPKGGIGATPKATPDHSPSRAHASSSSSSSSSPSVNPEPIASGVNSTVVTPAGMVCARLRQEARMADMNPSHPKLISMLDSGFTADEIVSAGIDATEKGKGFMYALAMAEGRRRDATASGMPPNARASPPGGRRQTAAEEREAVSIALTGRKANHERSNASNAERDITGESTRIT